MSVAQGDFPEKAQMQIDKLIEKNNLLNVDLKDKNEKIIELLAEMEDVKIQVFARDKSIELQQNQIEELLEEMRELKGLENQLKRVE
jgi:chromosome segregation ATPase